jgi:DNA-binding response OmpR family regulator
MTSYKVNPEDVRDAPPAPPDRRGARIILAEDEEEMRILLTRSLRDAGYEVKALADGLELMEQLASYLAPGNRVDVDLIISDIRMPWVNGLEVLRTVGRYIGYPRVILITAFGDDQVHSEARRLGAAAIMDKPFEIEELLARVREIVPGKCVSRPEGHVRETE